MQAQLDAFEAANQVRLPAPVRSAYAIMNGADEYADGWSSCMRFWPIGEWQRASTEYVGLNVASLISRDLFLCADFMVDCMQYAIDLDPSSAHFGQVVAIGATRLGTVAHDFDNFIACVVEDRNLHCYG